MNVVSPSTIDTPLFERLGLPDEAITQVKGQFTDLIPVGQIGIPADIGNVVAFLVSADSSFIIGEEIIIDGGVASAGQFPLTLAG